MNEDLLLSAAKSIRNYREISDTVRVGHVATALITENGNIYSGSNIHN